MRSKQLLFAVVVASGIAAAGAARADDRVSMGGHVGGSRIVHAPVPNAIPAPAMLRVDHVPPPRRAQPPARHDPYAYRGSQSPYQAALDRNGWFLGWEDRNGNPLPSRGRYGPPRPPSPYHRPVVDQNGWFLHWEDMSGDVSTRNAEARERRYDSD